jgi:hypothetical protein
MEESDYSKMKSYSFKNDKWTRKGVARLLRKQSGLEITAPPRFWDDEVFCQFTYMGDIYFVMEPWGDNDEYCIYTFSDSSESINIITNIFDSSDPIKVIDPLRVIFVLTQMSISMLIFVAIFKWITS